MDLQLFRPLHLYFTSFRSVKRSAWQILLHELGRNMVEIKTRYHKSERPSHFSRPLPLSLTSSFSSASSAIFHLSYGSLHRSVSWYYHVLIELLFFRKGWQSLMGLCRHPPPQRGPPTPQPHRTRPSSLELSPNIPFYSPMKLCVWYHGLNPRDAKNSDRSEILLPALGHIWTIPREMRHEEDAPTSPPPRD